MGLANLQDLSELINAMLLASPQGVSISGMIQEALRNLQLPGEKREHSDQSSLEHGIIDLVGRLAQTAKIAPQPANETDNRILELYQSGELAKNGYKGLEGNLFLAIKWIPITNNLPVIRDSSPL